MNLKIREFQKAIIDFTNSSELPIEVKLLCFKDILEQISKEADKVIALEIKCREKTTQQRNHMKEPRTMEGESNDE